jgi:hypothetical protein
MALGPSNGLHGNVMGTPKILYGGRIDPYDDGAFVNYVLMCTDCHEPHGSPNEFLLRTCVNGKSGILITQPGYYKEFCTACHWLAGYHSGPATDQCTDCHWHNWRL